MLPNNNEDSDEDDFDGYFLKPVNEYNILDKIKLANKELYETCQAPDTNSTSRVTFRRILVDYEPDYSSYEEDNSQPEENLGESTSSCQTENTTTSTDFVREDQIEEKVMSDIDENNDEIKEELETEQKIPEEVVEETKLVDEISEEISELCLNVESEQEQSEVESEKSTITTTIRVEFEKSEKNEKFENPKEEPEKPSPPIFKPLKIKPKEIKKTKSTENLANKKLESGPFALNLRPCCTSKTSIEAELPKYTGYFSEYGLSKKELILRAKRLENNRVRHVREAIRHMEEKVKQSTETESAFALWLKNKIRCQKNRSVNMYDLNKKKFKKKKKIN